MVRFSISFATKPTPIKIEINKPKTEIELRPRLTRIVRSMPTEIVPKRMAAPISKRAKTTRLYNTLSRTDSLKLWRAMAATRCAEASARDWKLETGNWKCETGNWKLETGFSSGDVALALGSGIGSTDGTGGASALESAVSVPKSWR